MTAAPQSRTAILARLAAIAPPPEPGVTGMAYGTARRLTVSIQRRRTRLLLLGEADAGSDIYRLELAAMEAEYTALHVLMEFMAVSPMRAERAAGLIRETRSDGDQVREGLWMRADTLHVDLNEVARLETALHAAPEPPAREDQR